jgi:hypothetical protein
MELAGVWSATDTAPRLAMKLAQNRCYYASSSVLRRWPSKLTWLFLGVGSRQLALYWTLDAIVAKTSCTLLIKS